jgi:outer membrane protein insertion porin family
MKRLFLLLLLLAVLCPVYGETFRIADIRVDGLQRISEGNVFSFIPIEVGDTLTPSLSRSTIRDLYRTGFFDDVALSRDGDVLVISVTERPAITSIQIDGNRQIKNEDLMPALANIGLPRARSSTSSNSTGCARNSSSSTSAAVTTGWRWKPR